MTAKTPQNKLILLIIIIIGLIPLGISLRYSYWVWQEWSIRQALAGGRQVAPAQTTTCQRYRGGKCLIGYRFNAPYQDTVLPFSGQSHTPCGDGCPPAGSTTIVEYSPQNPHRSLIMGYSYLRVHVFLGLVFFAVYPIVLRKQILAQLKRWFSPSKRPRK